MKEHLLEYLDTAKSESVRGLRILTEYFYAVDIFEPIKKNNIPIVSVFGSARTKPDQPEYKDCVKLGEMLYNHGYAVVTGASMGMMQAANKGVSNGIIKDLKKKFHKKSKDEIISTKQFKNTLDKRSVGLKITLPFEPVHNPFVGIYATFHYFMVRKFFFGMLSKAFIACEGGWGTRDELFEILTLVQTGKAPLMPIIYVSPEPDHLLNDIKYCVKKGYISKQDIELIDVVSDYKRAVSIIDKFYSLVKEVRYVKRGIIHLHLVKSLTSAQQKKLLNLCNKKYKGTFEEVVFAKRKVEFRGYNYKSYGILRRIIDELTKNH